MRNLRPTVIVAAIAAAALLVCASGPSASVPRVSDRSLTARHRVGPGPGGGARPTEPVDRILIHRLHDPAVEGPLIAPPAPECPRVPTGG